jgi:sugar O-acyltransferase (sialic acid O-acetyltransferase NeuD family)
MQSKVADGSVAIIGAGGHGAVVGSALLAAGYSIAGYYDDDDKKLGRDVVGGMVLGPVSELSSGTAKAVIAIGDNRVRERIAASLALEWVTVVHPFSWVDPSASLGPGTVVCAGAVVQPNVAVRSHVILNSGTIVNHGAVVDHFSHLSDAHLGAESRVGRGVLLGTGSKVVARVEVGSWATVGAGAVAIRDVRPGVTVVGVPARETDPGRLPVDLLGYDSV